MSAEKGQLITNQPTDWNTVPDRPVNLIITGVGGQGNVLAARLLGSALLRASLEVAVGDVFGLSQRGGSVASHVRFWRGPALPPLVPRGSADIILGFEPLEALRILAEFGHSQTRVLVNTRPVPPIGVLMGRNTYPEQDALMGNLASLSGEVIAIDAVELAHEAGDAQAVNMVMLGVLAASGSIPLSDEQLLEEIVGSLPKRFAATNERAFRLGVEAVRKMVSRNVSAETSS